jgi:hypothetical protein
MSIVLVCIGNFQPYILDNITFLLKLNIKDIYVITENSFFYYFDKFKNNINLIDVLTLQNNDYIKKTTLNKTFRKGFWVLTSLRFFYICELITKLNLTNIFHIENDVVLYYNPSLLLDKLECKIYMPFDCYKRNIASIVYIPNSTILKQVLGEYNYSKNDMENFYYIKQKTNLIKNFPIFNSKYSYTKEEHYVSMDFLKFNFIFDAAAIGQYLGGVDPRNICGDTRGFVNETCVIKYNKYEIFWNNIDGINKPFIKINDDITPIFNLHIHSKNLKKFT